MLILLFTFIIINYYVRYSIYILYNYCDIKEHFNIETIDVMSRRYPINLFVFFFCGGKSRSRCFQSLFRL